MTSDISPHLRGLAKKIWNYLKLDRPIQSSDLIFVMCSNDIRVAEHASELYLKGMAPYLAFSGALGRLTDGVWDRPEGKIFGEIAVQKGVPEDRIILEMKATNSGDNCRFSKILFDEHGISYDSMIVVQKPYMERRALVTAGLFFPDSTLYISSPDISYEDYPFDLVDEHLLIEVMVGDLQRIKEYPKLGYQLPQDIPNEVWTAFEELVEYGFDSHLI